MNPQSTPNQSKPKGKQNIELKRIKKTSFGIPEKAKEEQIGDESK